ncbi:alpha/beta hydrolase [Niabella terrae]
MTNTKMNLTAANDPHILKEVRAFLETLNAGDGPPIETLTPVQARQVLTDAQEGVATDVSGILESEIEIPVNNSSLRLHIVKPAGLNRERPAFIFIHGGGWVLGDYPTHRRFVRDLVVASGVIAVFPDYSPAPEAQFPVAIEQIYASLEWVSVNGSQIGVDSSKLAIVGNSVGGNMAAAVALMAKDRQGPQIQQLVLFWPVTDARFDTKSYQTMGEGRFLSRNMMIWFWDQYLPDPHARRQPYAAPLEASVDQLKGLPPTLIQIAENDVLHDEGQAFGRKLDEAGVAVTLTCYDGLIHDYGLLNALAAVPAVKTALGQAAAVIKKALR